MSQAGSQVNRDEFIEAVRDIYREWCDYSSDEFIVDDTRLPDFEDALSKVDQYGLQPKAGATEKAYCVICGPCSQNNESALVISDLTQSLSEAASELRRIKDLNHRLVSNRQESTRLLRVASMLMDDFGVRSEIKELLVRIENLEEE